MALPACSAITVAFIEHKNINNIKINSHLAAFENDKKNKAACEKLQTTWQYQSLAKRFHFIHLSLLGSWHVFVKK